ncbi:MAG: glycosyl hydrolase-related protein, partial [Anaerolineae bacterium]
APLLIAAFKKAEQGADNEYILRLWNPTTDEVRAAAIGGDVFAVTRARLNDHVERDLGAELLLSDGSLTVDVAGHEMLTLRVWLAAKGE